MSKILSFIIIFLLFGCKVDTGEIVKIESNGKLTKVADTNSSEREEIIFNNKKTYNKDDMIGQLMCVGINSNTLDNDLKNIIDKYKPGSFILFNRNIKSTNQLKRLTSDIKKYYVEKGYIKPFIFVDQEGGRVDRLGKIEKKINSASWYCAKSNAKKYVEDLNYRLSKYGIDSPLCPILDTNASNAKGAIGDRSFSGNYNKVCEFGKAVLNEFKNTNMISVAKHFPGHGATTVDSHYNLPVINKTYEQLKQTDLLPFESNYEFMDGIMVAHILVPSVDSVPASLSQKWMKIIRQNGFNGLILSDDLTMGALKKYGEIKDRFVQFIDAGGDIGLICHYKDLSSIYNEIKKIDEKRINESFERILKLKNEKIK